MLSKSPSKIRFSKTVLSSDEVVVSPHLAYDVSEVAQMVEMGKSISHVQVESQYYDGSVDCSFDVPLERQRGIDINDAYQLAQSSSKKVSKSKLKFMN